MTGWTVLPPGAVLDAPQFGPELPAGATLDPTHAISPATGNFITDAGRFLGTAAMKAGTALLSPLIGTQTANLPIAKVDDQPPPQTPDQAEAQGFNRLGLTEYQPTTMGGRVGMNALSTALMAATDPAAIPAAAAGGATSEIAREMVPNHPLAAALLGFIPGAAGARGLANLPLGASSSSLPAADADLADAAVNTYGIPLNVGQLSNHPFTRIAYSQLARVPFSGVAEDAATQRAALNRAVLNQFGEDAEASSPDLLNNAHERLGNSFDSIAGRTTIQADPLAADLAQIETSAPMVLTGQEYEPIGKQIDNILGQVRPDNTISGEAYQALTRRGAPLDVAQRSSNPNISHVAGQVRDALDNALENSASPQDVADLRDTRRQYKALMTVEPLTLRADTPGGPAPSVGDISPTALRGAVNRSYGNSARDALGDNPLNDLARIGQRFLKEPPNSETASRETVSHLVGHAGALAAALIGGHEMGIPIEDMMLYGGGALGAGRVAGSVLRSKMLANRLISGALNPAPFNFTSPSPLARVLVGNLPPMLPAPGGAATSSN